MTLKISLPAIGFLLFCLPLQAGLSSSASETLPQPDPSLLPQDVVEIVINALGRNDHPHLNAGIETTFNFASPENKRNTGPLPKFIRMVKTHPYEEMVDHRASELSEVVQVGNNAYVLVKLTTIEGGLAVYAFRLSKQASGDFQDMWMTDAVWPVSKAQGF